MRATLGMSVTRTNPSGTTTSRTAFIGKETEKAIRIDALALILKEGVLIERKSPLQNPAVSEGYWFPKSVVTVTGNEIEISSKKFQRIFEANFGEFITVL